MHCLRLPRVPAASQPSPWAELFRAVGAESFRSITIWSFLHEIEMRSFRDLKGMGKMGYTVRKTHSICPVCLAKLPAEIVKREQSYCLEKTCRDHSSFSTVIWRGDYPSFESWGNYHPLVELETVTPDCPKNCGLCPGHLQKTCCVLVEVTKRCNLRCSFCFAQSENLSADPAVGQLAETFKQLVKDGNTFVQISGGEPTLRDDLLDIIAAAKAAGCENIQLNSNGIRIGSDKAYLKALAKAGLSFVFMQFDGTNDSIYEKLRGRPLLAEKQAAIRVCSEENIGVVLVPTLVPGVNDQSIGEIVNFGIANSPAVRGVHFQPVSYFGRWLATNPGDCASERPPHPSPLPKGRGSLGVPVEKASSLPLGRETE